MDTIAANAFAQHQYPYFAENESLGVNVYLVPDKSKFLSAWAGPTPPGVTILSRTAVNQPLALAVAYWRGSVDVQGNCHVTMSLRISDSTGKIIGESKDVPICVGHKLPPKGLLGLGDVVEDLTASGSPSDLKIDTSFVDHVSMRTLDVSVPLEVIAQPP